MSAAAQIELHRFPDSNPTLALLVYRGALDLAGDAAETCEALFARHGWSGGWRNGIYAYHHFHATAHEVLGIVKGEARVRFGGERGALVEVRAGDVVVIPAGVAHKRESAGRDLLVVGAYPGGRAPDIHRGEPGGQRERSPGVPLPAADPVFGRDGPLLQNWARTAT